MSKARCHSARPGPKFGSAINVYDVLVIASLRTSKTKPQERSIHIPTAQAITIDDSINDNRILLVIKDVPQWHMTYTFRPGESSGEGRVQATHDIDTTPPLRKTVVLCIQNFVKYAITRSLQLPHHARQENSLIESSKSNNVLENESPTPQKDDAINSLLI